MNFLIISGGKKVDIEIAKGYISMADYIICVDKGLEYANENEIKPNLILGDMDSVDEKILNMYDKNTINIFPRDKDYTDTTIAIKKAISLGAKEVNLIGVTGSRIDHTLANIKLLLELKKNKVKAKIIDDYNVIFLVDDYIKVKKKSNQVVSLIPLDECYDVMTKGLVYPLNEEDIGIEWNIGISNKISDKYGEISLRKGNLLVIVTKESE